MMTFRIISAVLVLSFQALAFAPQKMISYNIRQDTASDKGVKDWKQRRSDVIKFLNEQRASVVGMQEVRNNQLKDIEKGVPGYGSVGVGREDGIAKGEYSPILYDKSVWKMDEKENGTFWLSDTPKMVGSRTWGNSHTRICSWVRLIDNAGKGLYIYNTHWDHISVNAREKSALLILETIKKRVHQDESYILMGDLNANTKSVALNTLLSSGLLIDPAKQQLKTHNSWKPAIEDGLRIDHIFISPELKVAEVKVVATGDPPASDHHPVVMTIDLEAAGDSK